MRGARFLIRYRGPLQTLRARLVSGFRGEQTSVPDASEQLFVCQTVIKCTTKTYEGNTDKDVHWLPHALPRTASLKLTARNRNTWVHWGDVSVAGHHFTVRDKDNTLNRLQNVSSVRYQEKYNCVKHKTSNPPAAALGPLRHFVLLLRCMKTFVVQSYN